MEITELPQRPPRGYTSWTQYYEDLIKHVNPNRESTFFMHDRPNLNILTTFQPSATVTTTRHRIADVKEKVFEELWKYRLNAEDVHTLHVIHRYVHMLTHSGGGIDQELYDKYENLSRRLDLQWKAGVMREN